MKFKFVPKKDLVGVVTLSIFPEFNKNNWFEGSFQEKMTEWFEDNVGFRTYLVKTDNQINWDIFKEVSSKTNTRLVRGLDNYLFEYNYISEYSRRPQTSLTDLELEVELLKKFQDALQERGVEFLLVISPSKANIYREFIPSDYIFTDRQEIKRNYDHVIQLLNKHGVNYVDGTQILKDVKFNTSYEVFTKGGTHWNYYGACKVSEKIVKEMESLVGEDLNQVICDPPIVDNDSYGIDRDLVGLINIWDEEDIDSPTPHPRLEVEESRTGFMPHILFVGDSFSHTLLQIMDNRIYKYRELSYYFKRNIIFDHGNYSENTDDILKWWDSIWEKDVVIIENNESHMHNIGFGFVDYVLKILELEEYEE